MNAEIEMTAQQIIELCTKKQQYLRNSPRAVIEELLHQSQEALHSEKFSVRTAAEINRTACILVLEELG